ncbi:MAG: phosphonate C-P lyase system protein PhnH [Paracoccaceae bacterium]
MSLRALEGGLADPPRELSRIFRAALDAMARPGRIAEIAGARPPEGLSPAAGTLLLCLADLETPVWLSSRLATGGVGEWLVFHTGAPIAAEPGRAAFGVGVWDEIAPLSRWSWGEANYPDRSATLLVEMPALDGASPRSLTGPGILGETSLAAPLPKDLLDDRAKLARAYPLGVDLFLTAGTRAVALPRTTRIGGH